MNALYVTKLVVGTIAGAGVGKIAKAVIENAVSEEVRKEFITKVGTFIIVGAVGAWAGTQTDSIIDSVATAVKATKLSIKEAKEKAVSSKKQKLEEKIMKTIDKKVQEGINLDNFKEKCDEKFSKIKVNWTDHQIHTDRVLITPVVTK